MTADPMHLELAPGVFVERIVFSSTIETGRKRSLLGVVASWRQKNPSGVLAAARQRRGAQNPSGVVAAE
jgi:hypothetical protein